MIRMPPFQMSRAVADMAEDVWHKRSKLLRPERDALYLPYRLSVSNHVSDIDLNFYVHYVATSSRWFYTLSDTAPFHFRTHDELLFRMEPDDSGHEDYSVRGESWRHYAFRDCLQPALEGRIKKAIEEVGSEDVVLLWDTFPLEDLRFDTSAHAAMNRRMFM